MLDGVDNAGDQNGIGFYGTYYQKSMLDVHITSPESTNPNSKVFYSHLHIIGLDFQSKILLSKELLNSATQFSKAEGDLNWGLSPIHPYPESLREPKRPWLDNKSELRF